VMRLVTWNLNHRARPRTITPAVTAVVAALAPTVAVFTEYVPGASHQLLLAALSEVGLRHTLMPAFAPKENHVLVASSLALEQGPIRPPAIAPSVPSNALHVCVPEGGFDLLGLRVPDYSRQPRVRHACWKWIEATAHFLVDKPFVLIGDFNADPRYPRSRCGDRIAALVAAGWRHAVGEGGSYWTPRGHAVNIDHAFVTPHFEVRTAQYVKEIDGIFLAGTLGAVSDHAALLVTVVRAEAS
jgi:endonuclease/exonuclease/phosphatase family metal-dependent hydrolase